MADKQRFCSTKHRVYASREGVGPNMASRKLDNEADSDTSINAALRAAEAFTPVKIAEHKTVLAIKVRRTRPDPGSWEVTVPSASSLAATKIREALVDHIGDLLTLANKLGAAAGEPVLILSTRRRATK